ncbi:MAG TPA: hypothetical protein VKQ11_02440 [Candidatus Sulfotelmatobacter sp.]|nr:hypothetical protein [Candidatus Sulfotelmatobacter sp.]
MTSSNTGPIACSLTADNLKNRLAWIGELTRDALRRHERRDLVLDLRYAPEAADRVREMVRKEQECCAFLAFETHEDPDEIRLTITAPEAARKAADELFEQFVASVPTKTVLGCCISEAKCEQ